MRDNEILFYFIRDFLFFPFGHDFRENSSWNSLWKLSLVSVFINEWESEWINQVSKTWFNSWNSIESKSCKIDEKWQKSSTKKHEPRLFIALHCVSLFYTNKLNQNDQVDYYWDRKKKVSSSSFYQYIFLLLSRFSCFFFCCESRRWQKTHKFSSFSNFPLLKFSFLFSLCFFYHR